MKRLHACMLAALLAGCAGASQLRPGLSSAEEVEARMGRAAEKRARPDGETWLYYPDQPFGRKMFVARVARDGKLVAVEQRLSEEYVGKLVPNQSRKDDVRDLLGPPYETLTIPRMQRETWSWHMRRYGDLPAGLHVQMSPDGIVREIYLLDETRSNDKADRGSSR